MLSKLAALKSAGGGNIFSVTLRGTYTNTSAVTSLTNAGVTVSISS